MKGLGLVIFRSLGIGLEFFHHTISQVHNACYSSENPLSHASVSELRTNLMSRPYYSNWKRECGLGNHSGAMRWTKLRVLLLTLLFRWISLEIVPIVISLRLQTTGKNYIYMEFSIFAHDSGHNYAPNTAKLRLKIA